jgi:hypothetical protein
MVRRLVNDEHKKDMKGSRHGLNEVVFWHLPGGPEKKNKKPVRIISVLVTVRIEHFTYTSLVSHAI